MRPGIRKGYRFGALPKWLQWQPPVRQTVAIEFGEEFPNLLVHECHLIIVVGPIATNNGRVRVIGRQYYFVSSNAEIGFSVFGCYLTFMAGGQVVDRKEWLIRLPVVVTGFSAALTPTLWTT